MTKSTNQTVSSTVEFNNIWAMKMKTGLINDIDITKAVMTNQNSTIKGHVIASTIKVLNNLEFAQDPTWWQKPYGTLKVKGNVHVNDLLVDTTSVLKDISEYWTKDGNQVDIFK